MVGTPAEATGRGTERVGKSWLNMASGMVCQRLLPTACADSLLLTRLWTFVQRKLVVELGFRSNVEVTSTLIDYAKPLGLTDAKLRFGDVLNGEILIGLGSVFHCFIR